MPAGWQRIEAKHMKRRNHLTASAPILDRLSMQPGLDMESERRAALPIPASAGLSDDLTCVHLDDATAAYILATRNPFDLLRNSASQLAGLMVLTAAGARDVIAHPMLQRALEAREEADEAIRSFAGRIPARAKHHRHHVLRANEALASALVAARRNPHRNDPAVMDSILAPLRSAYRELQWAAFALPGFEIVALSQGCCAQTAETKAR
jgi:hypothetical protein